MGGMWDGMRADEKEVNSPVAFAAALLLGGGWVDALVAGLAKVAWEVLFRGGGAIGEADVVAVGGLVGASHWREVLALGWWV